MNSFKAANHAIVYAVMDNDNKQMSELINKMAVQGKIYASYKIDEKGFTSAIAHMSIGNEIGCEVFDPEVLGLPSEKERVGDMILEVDFEDVEELADAGMIHIGETNMQFFITIGDQNIFIDKLKEMISK